MDDSLIDDGRLSTTRKSQLPGAGFFYPDSLDADRKAERIEATVSEATAIVVADSDADGLGCAALIREKYNDLRPWEPYQTQLQARIERYRGNKEESSESDEIELPTDSAVGIVGAGPHSIGQTLELVAESAPQGVDLYICDLCPDGFHHVKDSLTDAVAKASSVRWFDHHQWEIETATAVREAGVELLIGDSDQECSTDVAYRGLSDDFDERWEEIAAVTRDHDLWQKEDPRSDDIADYAYWVSTEEYVTAIGTYGVELSSLIHEFLNLRRTEKQELIEAAVHRAELTEVGPWTVGVTYGRCSQNEVAEALRTQGADAAVIVKPAGSASIRGSESFALAHKVAGYVNGGGHPKAAGCKPNIYDDMLDYAHHWSTQGATTKRVILDAFERVATEQSD
jgi:oligoribonuclease NrnB/cAMP/cGMP phosphodiesterase (DHH superfamily)